MCGCLLVPTLVEGKINCFSSKANTERAPICYCCGVWGFFSAFFAVYAECENVFESLFSDQWLLYHDKVPVMDYSLAHPSAWQNCCLVLSCLSNFPSFSYIFISISLQHLFSDDHLFSACTSSSIFFNP